MGVRTKAALTATVLALGLSGGVTTALPSAQAQDTSSWCSGAVSPPCVVSASRDGVAVTSGNANFDVGVNFFPAADNTESNDMQIVVTVPSAADWDLGQAESQHLWSVTVDLGKVFVPRVAAVDGTNADISRDKQVDGSYQVTISGRPVHETDNSECNTGSDPWTCPSQATHDFWTFHGEVTDYNSWTDVAQRNSMFGLNYFSNIGNLDWPPQVANDSTTGSQQILVDMANQHEFSNAATFHGFLTMDIPYAFLRSVYGVDDPASMIGSSVSADVTKWNGGTSTSGTTSVTADSTNNSLDVTATDITFSAKRLHIHRGVVTPTHPTKPAAHRISTHRGRVAFTKSRSRGSKITGYYARCVSLDGKTVRTGSGSGSPVVVTGLVTGQRYDCRVRAKSRAGHSTWSSSDRMAAPA